MSKCGNVGNLPPLQEFFVKSIYTLHFNSLVKNYFDEIFAKNRGETFSNSHTVAVERKYPFFHTVHNMQCIIDTTHFQQRFRESNVLTYYKNYRRVDLTNFLCYAENILFFYFIGTFTMARNQNWWKCERKV